MLRSLCCAGLALAVCAVVVLAAEYKEARVKSVDPDKKTLNVAVDDKTEKVLKYDDKTKWSVSFKGETKEFDKDKLDKFLTYVKDKGFTANINTDKDSDRASSVEVTFKKKDKDKGPDR